MKTKGVLLILSVFVISFVIGCSNGSNMSYDFESEEAQRPEYVEKVINSIKSTTQKNKRTICIGSIELQVESKNRSTTPSFSANVINTISYLEENGQHPYIFTNGNGDNFILGYKKTDGANIPVCKLTDNFVRYYFDTIYRIIKIDEERNKYIVSSPLEIRNFQGHVWALIDTKNGNFYDVSEYNMYESIADDSNIYVGNSKEKSIYKIDTKTLKATPLNNGSRFPLDGYQLGIVNKEYLICRKYNGNEFYLVYTNKNIAPKRIDFDNVAGLDDKYKIIIKDEDDNRKFRPIIMKGKDGQLYFFATDYTDVFTGKISFDTSSTVVKVILTDTETKKIPGSYYYSRSVNHPNGTTHSIYTNECTSCSEAYIQGIPDYSTPSYPLRFHSMIFDYDKLVLATNHSHLIKLSIENNKLNVSFPLDKSDLYYSPAIYQNDVFYYIHMNDQNIPTLYKYDVKTENSEPSVLYSHKDLINKLSIKKDGLVLHKYLNRTEVGIFLFDLATKQIKQIGNNNTEINSIVEMNF